MKWRPWSRFEFALLVRAYRTSNRFHRQRLIESLAVRRGCDEAAILLKAYREGLHTTVVKAYSKTLTPAQRRRLLAVYSIPDNDAFRAALTAFAVSADKTRECCILHAHLLGYNRRKLTCHR